MKKLVRRLLALGLGLVLALGLLEIGLRTTGALPIQRNPLRGFHRPHPLLGWSGVPDYSAKFRQADFDVVIEHDPSGFRRAGHGIGELESDAVRVAFLGDSFTWGWGVRQGAVFTDRLQDLLGRGVEIRNLGVNAYGTGQERLLLESDVLGWQPDVVVVMFCWNDLQDNLDEKKGRRPWFEQVEGELVARNVPVRRDISGWGKAVARRSLAISLLNYQADAAIAKLKARRAKPVEAGPRPESGRTSGRAGAEEERQWAAFEALLAEMKALCDGSPGEPELRLALIPDRRREGPQGAGDTSARMDRLSGICARVGIPLLDLAPGLAAGSDGAGDRRAAFFPHDGHWTAEGHARVARFLSEAWSWARD